MGWSTRALSDQSIGLEVTREVPERRLTFDEWVSTFRPVFLGHGFICMLQVGPAVYCALLRVSVL